MLKPAPLNATFDSARLAYLLPALRSVSFSFLPSGGQRHRFDLRLGAFRNDVGDGRKIEHELDAALAVVGQFHRHLLDRNRISRRLVELLRADILHAHGLRCARLDDALRREQDEILVGRLARFRALFIEQARSATTSIVIGDGVRVVDANDRACRLYPTASCRRPSA